MKLSFRYAIAAIVMAGALFLLSPTLMPEDINLPGASRISLGPDLKGGVQLTLGVDTEKAVQSALINSGQVLRQKAREAGITVLGPRQMPGGVQELIIARANQADAFLALVQKDAPQVVPGTPRTGSDGAVHLPYTFTPAFVKQTQDLAVDQVLRTISSRIDQFGVAEPDIRKQQGDRILIQLPGLTNVNRAVQLVEKSADLSFHLVRDDIPQGYLPPGVAFYPMMGKHGEEGNAKLALDSTPLLSGKEVADARPGFDDKNTSMVSLSFTPRGAALFEMATGEHVGKRLAIVLDGTIHSAPVIQERIAGGTASISGQFTPEEARMLDIMLCLHAEHGGGNNSTFTTRVMSSADTDPYSVYAAAICSLKGKKHGGANHQVRAMQADIKQHVSNWEDDDEVADYLAKIVNKQAYDKSGLVYGMGHAVYTLSDPRAMICKKYAKKLAEGTEFEAEYRLLESIERLAPEVILRERGTKKDMCANIDMYSGFVYSMMGIPEDLYTPLFACARMAGWAAHRFEEIVAGKRIIRPAYKSTRSGSRPYTPISER